METERVIVGFTIKILRKDIIKLQQIRLCKAIGITQGYLSKVENGIQELGLKDYYSLLKAFQIKSVEFENCVQTTALLLRHYNLFESPNDLTTDKKRELIKHLEIVLRNKEPHGDSLSNQKRIKKVA